MRAHGVASGGAIIECIFLLTLKNPIKTHLCLVPSICFAIPNELFNIWGEDVPNLSPSLEGDDKKTSLSGTDLTNRLMKRVEFGVSLSAV